MYFVRTKLRWLELLRQGHTQTELARLAGVNRKTLNRWKKKHEQSGEAGLLPQSKRPRSCPWQTQAEVVELVKKLRCSRPRPLGPIPISLKLKKHYSVSSHWRTVAKILKREGLVVRPVRIKQKETAPKYAVTFSGELVEVDVKYASKINGRWVYQFTATDCFSRMRCIETYSEQTNFTALIFLERVIKYFPFKITGVKTDNASIFTNRYTGYQKSTDPLNPKLHVFDRLCQQHGLTHYLIDKGKPQQNGKVERSHRTDNEELYRVEKFRSLQGLRVKQRRWLHYYNHEREHQGINNLTPFEKYQQNCDNLKVNQLGHMSV